MGSSTFGMLLHRKSYFGSAEKRLSASLGTDELLFLPRLGSTEVYPEFGDLIGVRGANSEVVQKAYIVVGSATPIELAWNVPVAAY